MRDDGALLRYVYGEWRSTCSKCGETFVKCDGNGLPIDGTSEWELSGFTALPYEDSLTYR